MVSKLRRRLHEVAQLQPALRRPRAYMNWARANFELMTRASVVRARPLKLTFDPTNYCQLKCPLCPTGARVHDRDRGRAQLHLFEHLMEEVGDYVFLIDFFNWGEPLLNDRVEEFIAMASRRNIVTFMSSNLSLPLSDVRLKRIVQSGLSELIVSLDGCSPESYGQYRRNGRFDLVVENVKRIVAIKRELGVTNPRINWQFLVFKFNEHEIPMARKLADELGVDSLTFRAPFLDEGRVPLSERDRAQVANWTPSATEFNRYTPESDAYTSVPERPRCGWHYMSTAINWDGTVAPCCTVFEQKDDFGKLGSGDNDNAMPAQYMSIVNNPKFVAVRDNFAGRSKNTGLVCEKCPTPFLMGYHHHLNRQILLYALSSVVSTFENPMARFKRWRLKPTQLTPSDGPTPLLDDITT